MIKPLNTFLTKLNTSRQQQPLLFWLRATIVLAAVLLFVVQRNFWTPDTLFIALLAIFAVMGQARAFIVRFAPFILLLLIYDSFRSIADQLNQNVHYFEMITFDKALFGGTLPTADLQHVLWHGAVQWYDFYFYFLYTIHFVAPVLLAVLLWKVSRGVYYWQFVTALVGLSFAAFITYVIFPAAPPWMASDMHFIEPIHHISSDVWAAMGVTNFSEVYANISPNPVAAVPSLHSAYPLLFVLFLAKVFSWRRVWWAMIYPISVWIGVTYLGEHYVFDVLLGALYAVGAYYATMRYFAWRERNAISFKQNYLRGYNWAYNRTILANRDQGEG